MSQFAIQQDGKEFLLNPSQIALAEGMKVDKITYEENFLILTLVSGRKVEIGELAREFTVMERTILGALKGFPADWRTALELAPAGTLVNIWRRIEDSLPK